MGLHWRARNRQPCGQFCAARQTPIVEIHRDRDTDALDAGALIVSLVCIVLSKNTFDYSPDRGAGDVGLLSNRRRTDPQVETDLRKNVLARQSPKTIPMVGYGG